jgi:hypothetical protein
LLHAVFPIGTRPANRLPGPSLRVPDDVNFVVMFHAFTGLQHRSWRYLYLLACIVPASEPTPFPLRGGFRRFVIGFCGSTYNTVNHLNIIFPVNLGGSCASIRSELYQDRIVLKWFQNFCSGMILGFFGRFHGSRTRLRENMTNVSIGRKNGRSAVGKKSWSRRQERSAGYRRAISAPQS